MRISSHVQFDTKIVQFFRSANTGKLKLHLKQNSECETVASIEYIQGEHKNTA